MYLCMYLNFIIDQTLNDFANSVMSVTPDKYRTSTNGVMEVSQHGNDFHITCPLWGIHRPLMVTLSQRANDAEFRFFLCSPGKKFNNQSSGQSFQIQWHPCAVTVKVCFQKKFQWQVKPSHWNSPYQYHNIHVSVIPATTDQYVFAISAEAVSHGPFHSLACQWVNTCRI